MNLNYPITDKLQCICCGEDVKKLYPDEDTPEARPNQMWEDGIVDNVSAGYGSSVDGNMYLIAVCDDCIKLKGIKIGENL